MRLPRIAVLVAAVGSTLLSSISAPTLNARTLSTPPDHQAIQEPPTPMFYLPLMTNAVLSPAPPPSAPPDVQGPARPLSELSPGAVEAATSRSSTAGIAVWDMPRGDLFAYNGTTRFSMYSTVKVPIMLTLLDQAMHAGRPLTTEEDVLVKRMIQQSGNDATSELYYRRIGGEAAVESFLRSHAIAGIDMNRSAWGLSTTTAPEMARLMGKLGNCTILNRSWCDYALAVMRNVTASQYWGVSAGVPDVYTTRTVALKNGWYPAGDGWAINSVGFVDDNGKLYAVAVYTRPSSTMNTGIATVESISRAIYPAVPVR